MCLHTIYYIKSWVSQELSISWTEFLKNWVSQELSLSRTEFIKNSLSQKTQFLKKSSVYRELNLSRIEFSRTEFLKNLVYHNWSFQNWVIEEKFVIKICEIINFVKHFLDNDGEAVMPGLQVYIYQNILFSSAKADVPLNRIGVGRVVDLHLGIL